MARKRKRSSKKHNLAPDYRRQEKEKLIRSRRKTILFNEKEMSLIDSYCQKYSIRNKSAFIRESVISHILEQMDDNYPTLF